MNQSRGESIIETKLDNLDPESPRYAVLNAALDFKSSWVRLGEELIEVKRTQLYRGWGFENFEAYCKEEIRITKETAAKLCRSFTYLNENQPELAHPEPGEPPPRVPDYKAVDLLSRLKEDARVPEPLYRDLSRAAFEEDLGHTELRRRAREEAPEAFTRQRSAQPDPRRQLRSAMSLCARLIESLANVDIGDDAPLETAETLRDMLATHLAEV